MNVMHNILLCLVALWQSGANIVQKTTEYIFTPGNTHQPSHQPITPEQQFRLYMMQGNYKACTQLLKEQSPELTPHDYRSLKTLQRIEQNQHKQQDAEICASFLFNYLVDHGVLNPQDQTYRGTEEAVEKLIRDNNSVQKKLFNAIAADDTGAMELYLQQGADLHRPINSLEPVQFAIARSSTKALEFMHSKGVQFTPQHLDSAYTFAFLLHSNQGEEVSDMAFPGMTTKEGYRTFIRRAQEVVEIINQKMTR